MPAAAVRDNAKAAALNAVVNGPDNNKPVPPSILTRFSSSKDEVVRL
jgi:hypothetical protein